VLSPAQPQPGLPQQQPPQAQAPLQGEPRPRVANAQPVLQPLASASVPVHPPVAYPVLSPVSVLSQPQAVPVQPQAVRGQPESAQPQGLGQAQPQVDQRQPPLQPQVFSPTQPQAGLPQQQDPQAQAPLQGEPRPQVANAQPVLQPVASAPVSVHPQGGDPVPAQAVQGRVPLAVPAQASRLRLGDGAEEADQGVNSGEAWVPRSSWESLAATPPVQVVAVPPAVASQAATAAEPQGPALDRFDVAQMVAQVTRTLAWRDLDALQAGREVVLHLDEALMPQTVLTFRPVATGPGAPADGLGPEVEVSLQTQSTEVRAFLDNHGQALVEAMARQAPGLRWAPAPELALQGPAPAATAVLAASPGQGTGRDADGGSGSARDPDARDRQERDPSQGQPSSQGQGQGHQGQGASAGSGDRADADAVARWGSESEAARSRAMSAFADALDR
jgi:hypothetical protein